MTEFVLVLPILASILAIILFLGWFMARKQRVEVANSYIVWRHFAGEETSNEAVNEKLLNRAAKLVDQRHSDGPTDAIDQWQAAADEVGPGAGDLAGELFYHRWPLGRQTRLEATYPPVLPIGEKFGSKLSFRYGLDGPEWVRGEAQHWEALADLYYNDYDSMLGGIADGGNTLAETLRDIHHANW
ncbi:MAG: hypothetical protein HQ546_05510 [Planctomycetes bacterium]|nr:hypothetical protein [Planctomycetota bacterium]